MTNATLKVNVGGDILRFEEPFGADQTRIEWFSVRDGILSVVTQQQPRRVRCFPLTNVSEWEYDASGES